MFYLIYNLILILLMPIFLIWWVISFLNPKYRIGWKERLGILPTEVLHSLRNFPVLWVHAVSVGEVNAALPLLHRLRERFPDKKIVVSTVTVTGHQQAKSKLEKVDALFYFPFDFPFIVKRVINDIHPDLFIFFETEIWPNLLTDLNQRKIPSVLVNGRLSDRSFRRYSKLNGFMKDVLSKITLALMQTNEDREKFLALRGIPERTVTTGNTKYDQVKRKGEMPMQKMTLFSEWEWWIAGSTHSNEEEMILRAFLVLRKEFPKLGLLLAPRHPERWSEVAGLLTRLEIPFIRRTDLDFKTKWNQSDSPVILLNTIGELSDSYYWASIAFVGGSLVPKGGHNILETAAWRKAPFFGPFSDNFREMIQIFKERGAGVEISGEMDLVPKISYYLKNRSLLEEMGRKAERILYEKQGATERNLEYISKLIQ
jgi:3-deoxy-D-manno-octulosonic-acid transferase